ncbi:MAG: hypothetical protein J2P30_12510 [Actinobacteria bacterium]|nr:hypothetical protein [Actinomycetota bacterium]
MTVMGQLLAGQAPLRGRASLELPVRPFGYREAAAFWGVNDPQLAVLLHAIVGGTPAYRREFVAFDAPRDDIRAASGSRAADGSWAASGRRVALIGLADLYQD